MKYVSISAATGWYWVANGGKSAEPVAGWAVTDAGNVVGLIAGKAAPDLILPPASAIGGRYVQEAQLTDAARATLKRPSF